MAEFVCPSCYAVNELPDYMAGKPTKCQVCGTQGVAATGKAAEPPPAVPPQAATIPPGGLAFRCPFCGSNRPPRVEKHFTGMGLTLLCGLPASAVFSGAGRGLEWWARWVLILLPLVGLAFAIIYRAAHTFCRDCKIRLG